MSRNRKYAVEDDETGDWYMITINSEEDGDWKIDVYESDRVTWLNSITEHEFFDIPDRLRGHIKAEIDRGQLNIAADNDSKKSTY